MSCLYIYVLIDGLINSFSQSVSQQICFEHVLPTGIFLGPGYQDLGQFPPFTWPVEGHQWGSLVRSPPTLLSGSPVDGLAYTLELHPHHHRQQPLAFPVPPLLCLRVCTPTTGHTLGRTDLRRRPAQALGVDSGFLGGAFWNPTESPRKGVGASCRPRRLTASSGGT